MQVDYGFIPDFKGSDTMLFISDSEGVRELVRLLSDLGSGAPQAFPIPTFRGHNCEVFLSSTAEQISTIIWDPETRLATWFLGPDAAADCANSLESLYLVEAGHQFLETEGGVQIMVAVGEYSPDDLFVS